MTSIAYLLASACALVALPAQAALVTWTVVGTLTGLPSDLGSLGLVNGTPYTYQVTFDSDTREYPGDAPYCCTFPDAVLALSFESGAFSVALAPGATAAMGASGSNFGVDGPVRLSMIDTLYKASPLLPIAPPVYAGTQISLEWGNPYAGTGFLIYASASQLAYSVPEPAAAPLLLAAALALALSRASRRMAAGCEPRWRTRWT